MEREHITRDLAFSYDANSLLEEIDFGEDSFYTKIEILEHISSLVIPFIEKAGPDVVFVDFACGSNQFCPLLPCKTIAFDVAQIAKQHGAIVEDWFSVKVDSLPPNLIIGLNPPFGYQGATARKFVEHALLFKPKYMFLILPNLRWSPPGYVLVYQENLANNSFYDPITNKIHKEISTTFNVFELSPTIPTVIIASAPQKSLSVEVTRKWTKKFPYIILRRVGRSTTKQFYCATSEENRCYINKGEVQYGKTWLDTGHKIESDYFLKLYFQDKDIPLEKLIALCQKIFANPEPGYDRKQPHAITTLYIREMVSKWQQES